MEQIPRRAYYEDRIKNLVNLPTLPIIATEIIRISREDRLSINQILPIIEKDPPLAMKVLKFANSPYYGLKEKVQSLRHAIVVIGLAQLTELATAFSILRAFAEREEEGLQWPLFWEHASATGFMAQLVAEELGITTGENLYSIGLLHDIGKLILYRVDPKNYRQAYLLSSRKRVSSTTAEQEIFGFSHAEAGYWISERWELPTGIRMGIRYHHDLDSLPEERFKTIVAILNIADALVNFWIARFGTQPVILKEENLAGWQVLQRSYPDNCALGLAALLERFKEQAPVIGEMARLIQS